MLTPIKRKSRKKKKPEASPACVVDVRQLPLFDEWGQAFSGLLDFESSGARSEDSHLVDGSVGELLPQARE